MASAIYAEVSGARGVASATALSCTFFLSILKNRLSLGTKHRSKTLGPPDMVYMSPQLGRYSKHHGHGAKTARNRAEALFTEL